MLEINRIQPLAQGTHRALYQYPGQSDWLVKTLLQPVYDKWRDAPWYKHRSRIGPYRSFHREFREFLAAKHTAPDPPPISHSLWQ